MHPLQFVKMVLYSPDSEFERNIAWTFHQSMGQADRAAFDQWLVDTEHPSAYEPGTTEQRFRQIVREQRILRAKALGTADPK